MSLCPGARGAGVLYWLAAGRGCQRMLLLAAAAARLVLLALLAGWLAGCQPLPSQQFPPLVEGAFKDS